MKKTIQHSFFYTQPPQIVWDYLTNPELLELWLMKNNFQPILGTEFQFRTSPIASLNFDGIFYCKVLELEHLKKLSYSWNSGPGNGVIDLESVVSWTLNARDNGTELSLEHTGFSNAHNLDFYQGLLHGWVEKLQNIDKLLKTNQHVATRS